MPRTADGRPLSYIALNGHGAYPRTGFIPRIFLAFNDYTGKGDMQFPGAKICLAVSGQLVSLPAFNNYTGRGDGLPSCCWLSTSRIVLVFID